MALDPSNSSNLEQLALKGLSSGAAAVTLVGCQQRDLHTRGCQLYRWMESATTHTDYVYMTRSRLTRN